MGIHGEPGTRSGPLETADQIAGELVSALLEDLPYEPGEPAAVLVSGLGATPREELYILYRKVH
jgi:dihydroxyacetone kinase